MSDWVSIQETEDGEAVEIPTEEDGTILLSSVAAQFPGVTGLRFKFGQKWRGVRCAQGVLHAPDKDKGWGNEVYFCVIPNKEGEVGKKRAKSEEEDQEDSAKRSKSASTDTHDLVMLNLPFDISESEVKDIFEERFGKVLMIQIKMNQDGTSKGYGFIRFENKEVQDKVTWTRHEIRGRWCDIRVPDSVDPSSKHSHANRIFVGRVTKDLTDLDLKRHFSKFGEVIDVYFPKPFRSFAFVTFASPKAVPPLLGQDHIIKGCSVHIGSADKKAKANSGSEGGNQQSGRMWESGGGSSHRNYYY